MSLEEDVGGVGEAIERRSDIISVDGIFGCGDAEAGWMDKYQKFGM